MGTHVSLAYRVIKIKWREAACAYTIFLGYLVRRPRNDDIIIARSTLSTHTLVSTYYPSLKGEMAESMFKESTKSKYVKKDEGPIRSHLEGVPTRKSGAILASKWNE